MGEPRSSDGRRPRAGCLVIGIGNDLRRDDGVGHVVAGALARDVPDVDVLLVHQVLPELATALTGRRTVVFVDALISAPGAEGVVTVGRVAPGGSGSGLGHVSEPAGLLALTEALDGGAPDAWIVTLPVTDLGVGEGLSPDAARLVPAAVAAIMRLRGETTGERRANEARTGNHHPTLDG